MPRDLTEIACAAIAAHARGDLDAAVADFHPDISWEVGEDLVLDARTYRGHAGVKDFWAEWAGAFEGFRLETEDAVPVAPGLVLVTNRAYGTGAASGATVASGRFYEIFEFEGEQVVRVRIHAGRRAALAAVEELSVSRAPAPAPGSGAAPTDARAG